MRADPAPKHILCDGVPKDLVAEFAATHGMSVVDEPVGAQAPHILVLSDASESRLSSALHAGVRGCFEVVDGAHGMNAEALDRLHACRLFLSLSTATAYRTQLAPLVSGWIAQTANISADLTSNLELAIQEALANALIHGNLGLEKTLPDSFRDLDHYGEDVRHRLGDHEHGQLRIELASCWSDETIEISILDHGAGFDVDAAHDSGVTGWGLTLIRQMALSVDVTDGGRKITMRFAR